MKAALYSNGKVVTGCTHGDAFSLLSEAEKDDCLSGWYDESRRRFVTEDSAFFMKNIVLLRHAHAENDQLTSRGIQQIVTTLPQLQGFVHSNTIVMCSPAERCEHTASLIATYFALEGCVNDNLRGTAIGENEYGPADDEKILAAFEEFPDNVMAVTHCTFIRKAVAMMTGQILTEIPNMVVASLSGNVLRNFQIYY